MVRKQVKEDRAKYAGREATKFGDRYRSHIADRASGLLRKLGFDRSQVIRDELRRKKLRVTEAPFEVPTQLAWREGQAY